VLAAGSAAARRPPPPPPLDSDRRPTFAGHYNDALRRSLRQVLESVLDDLEDSVVLDDDDDDGQSLGWRNGTAVRRHSNGAECRTTTSTADSNIIRSEESEIDRGDRDEVADDAMGD
jgi:hypothetical protein